MSNMSYCRFRNTLTDFRDAKNHLRDDLDGAEAEARRKLVREAKEFVEKAEYHGVTTGE